MIHIDREACIGCALCEALCPQNFKLNDEAKAEVVDQEMRDCVNEAKDNCPTMAIIVE